MNCIDLVQVLKLTSLVTIVAGYHNLVGWVSVSFGIAGFTVMNAVYF